MISAKIIEDSISGSKIRLTTMQICFHRFVLPEFNTHRMISKSFRSSRAVPVKTLLTEVRYSPALPVTWQVNQKGMQGGAEMDSETAAKCEAEWRKSANDAASSAEIQMGLGLHKSWANRVLEPYLYVHGVVTSVNYANLFALRCHPDAQPEFRVLAEAMRDALNESKPNRLKMGEWHLPYVTQEEREQMSITQATKLSVSRCARVSYRTHDGRLPNLEEDFALYDRLLGSVPLHASPAEHQATPDKRIGGGKWLKQKHHGNLAGWIQFRKTLWGEYVQE